MVLMAEQPRPEPITLASTVTCDHGSGLDCKENCTPTFTPPDSWPYFEAAAAEALSWRQGTRLSLLPSTLSIRQFDVTLRPSSTKLLLNVRPCPVSGTGHLLCPLGIPAILVSPHTTTAAQDARLSAAFDTALGEWKKGRMETRIAIQAAGGHAADWSIYFVPVDKGRSRGVLTVWPTHLATPLDGVSGIPLPRPPVGNRIAAPADILDAAAGIFDFLSSYTAPEEEEEEEEEVEGPSLVDIVDVPVDGDKEEEEHGEDDSVDDLFSAHSSDPDESESVKADATDMFPSSAFPSPGKGEMDLDVDGLFDEVAELPEAPKMELPEPAPVAATATVTQVSSRAVSPRFSITEDDFNFFDSPAPQVTTSPVFEDVDQVNKMEVVEEVDEPPEVVEVAQADQVEPETTAEAKEASPQKAPSPRPLKRPISLAQLVPDAFAPLPLERRRRQRFAYGLPSPAATISIRAELVERLRKSHSEKYNYAAEWDVDSDTSEVETHSELTTGAPPTPSSTTSLEDRTPARQPSVPPPPDNEVEYDGTLCVGSEWTSLRGDDSVASALARAWGLAWPEERAPQVPPSPTSPPRPRVDPLAGLDVESVANALVRNRFFRSMFDPSEDTEPPRCLSQLTTSGAALSDLAPLPEPKIDEEEDAPTPTYTLPQANVNVGFGSAVMRISVAALRYWRELGLEPAGGPKDIKTFAICDPGEDSERLAASFLADMSEVYSGYQLGQHDVGDGEEAGVIPTAPADIGAAIDKALLRSSTTVVYILLQGGKMTPSLLAPLFQRPAASVHIVPVSSIRVPNLPTLAFEVYDGIERPVERVLLHGKPLDAPPISLPYHAFTLTSDLTKPELSMTWPQRSYDVMNRWRQIHAAYAYIPALNLLLLAMVDAQGDACQMKAVHLEPGHTWPDRVQAAYDAFTSFARTAATEYRLAICSHGTMSQAELDSWVTFLTPKKDQITLLCATPPASVATRARPPVSNIPPSAFANSSASIIDETLVGGTAVFANRMPVEQDTQTIYPPTSFLLTLASEHGTTSTTVYHVLFNPYDTPDLAPGLHRLACLARRRYALDAPLHLAAVGAAARGLIALAHSVGVRASIGDGPVGDVSVGNGSVGNGSAPDVIIPDAIIPDAARSPSVPPRPQLVKSESSSSVESVAVPLASVVAVS